MAMNLNVANRSLMELGASPLSAIDEASTTGDIVRAWYDQVVEAAFTVRPWTFGTVYELRTDGVEDADRPGWYRYARPADSGTQRYIGVYSVLQAQAFQPGPINTLYQDDNWNDQSLPYSVQDGAIITSESQCSITWYRLDDDVATWPAQFELYVSIRLAAAICMPLAKNSALRGTLVQMEEHRLKEAAEFDMAQGTRQPLSNSRLTGGRYR